MQLLRSVRYWAAALMLGIGWYPILLLPSHTRGWIEEGGQELTHVFCLALASLIMAWLFRRVIVQADTPLEHVMRGAGIPFVGCFFYVIIFELSWLIARTESLSLHELVSLPMLALVWTALAFYVVIPYGVFCQYVMSAAGRAVER